MEILKYYWKRFVSEVPLALKRLQILIGAVSASCGIVLTMATQLGISNGWIELIKLVALFAAGGAAFIQFATTNKNLQDPQ